ncbi:MAG: hypothetical protein JNL12_02375 [Planctomycetes bacterium]|nr:hypothetical protein [Planctomycetota bacterium]
MPLARPSFGLAFLCCLASSLPLPAQDPAPQAPPPAVTQTPEPSRRLDPTTAEALDRLATLLAQRRADRAAGNLDAAALAAVDADLQKLERQFASLAAQIEIEEFDKPSASAFDLQNELEQVLRPLLQLLKDATTGPRLVSDLKRRIESLEQQRARAEAALRAVERTRDQLPDGAARTEAERERSRRWQPVVQRLRDELLVLRANLTRLQADETSLLGSVAEQVRRFVQDSGTSLVLAATVFAVLFFGLRSLLDRLLQRRGGRGFSLRLLEVLCRVLLVVVAIAGALVVPFVRDDWLLLAVAIVFLLGAGWVLMRTLPQLFEQMRLLLNIGGVREGERLLVDGLPFRVEALRFYARLVNPDLQGGLLRMPLQQLIGKRSRAAAPDEPWFPSRPGDVVLLADGTFGPVRTQTPEVVVVEHWGAERTLPTAEFLRLSPRNLSRGFLAHTVLVLGRSEPVPDLAMLAKALHDGLHAALAELVPADHLHELAVSFRQPTALGFEFFATVRCDGRSALAYFAMQRTMQQAFVGFCLARGLRLPVAAAVPIAATPA